MSKHLVIAGHGKKPSGQIDYGAEGNGFKENNLTKEFCTLMDAYAGDDFVFVTDHDVYSYGDIVALANGCSDVTEIHFNAYDGKSYGTEVLIDVSFEPDEVDTRIHDVLAKNFYDRGFKKRSDLANMNRCKAASISYRLVEICFIDNDGDVTAYNKMKKNLAIDMVEAISGVRPVVAAVAPVVPVPTSGTLYKVQVGAYKTKTNATALQTKLKADGYDAVIVTG